MALKNLADGYGLPIGAFGDETIDLKIDLMEKLIFQMGHPEGPRKDQPHGLEHGSPVMPYHPFCQ
jgi:hypothetical protein